MRDAATIVRAEGPPVNPTITQLRKRIEAWQGRLGLLGIVHWRIESIEVNDEVSGSPNVNAAVWTHHQYDSCRFFFQRRFLSEASEPQLDKTIIHEWMHVVMRDHDITVESIEEDLAPAQRDQWEDQVRRKREQLVDNLARLIYDLT